MYLDKETYERAGLVGKPHGVKGQRDLKPRWGEWPFMACVRVNPTLLINAIVVEYNLRDPSMLRGKKGFDRLVYACKNVLNKPTTWLFYNLAKSMCRYT